MAGNFQQVNLPVQGMDCTSCASEIERAVRGLPGVAEVQVLLAAGRVTVVFDARQATSEQIVAAIEAAGYQVPRRASEAVPAPARRALSPLIGWGVLGLVALTVLVAALGERIGIFDAALERLPWWLPAAAILIGGWPVLRAVLAAARRGRITGHTLMSVGVLAAITVGEWTTAALIVFFMRFADWLEELTTRRSRQALQQLVALQPASARVLRDGQEVSVPVAEVRVGEIVLVRPGERIPVDGEVVDGQAPVDQAAITGESMPVEKGPGDAVFAATIAQAGFLKVRVTRPTADTTFARIVRLVEEAETQKAPVQRLADRFAGAYLPVVLLIALATLLLTGRVLNAVAVLVVACACAISMATPVVVLASVAHAARRGLLIKGGMALEQLARVDTLVVDKTGTLTHGLPQVTAIHTFEDDETTVVRAAAALESRSEHPLARAITAAAAERGLRLPEPQAFVVLPGQGISGLLDGQRWSIGNRRLMEHVEPAQAACAQALEASGHTVIFVAREARVVGIIGVRDTARAEARAALDELRRLGIRRMIMLTGDNQRSAAALAHELGLDYRAELLPQDKIAVVRELQADGACVLMVGDGINDAPALAQADVGVAMGAHGTHIALEAADVVLLRDDWRLLPLALRLARRARRTIWQNLGFTAAYNLVGIALAALGWLPPVWAAAAQSLPDVAIMLNSARLLRAQRAPSTRDRALREPINPTSPPPQRS
ncbi:heavy metal translocating P-type ATPase [Kallotenue papyrolyticum]|uniref:heavy metal translocating P-type ATPase n=1 Tax=Kallotenue papyrolyticum TaxID=1325125 RepID=UPI00049286F5|nr:cation-translocating P-type ATPase [Kallotenue papyrolyticum]